MSTVTSSKPTFSLPTWRPLEQDGVVYPDSDGKPMAESTAQFRYLTTIKLGLDGLFADQDDVFVAGDIFWYPVKGRPEINVAPDVLVAFGPPKGERRSYRQWDEGDIAPHVVFEMISRSNRDEAMGEKFRFYERYGVDEYYTYNPDNGELLGWTRAGEALRPIENLRGWVSPRLKVRFELDGIRLSLYDQSGEVFVQSDRVYADVKRHRRLAEREQARADQEQARADQERSRADQERSRADRLAERLRALGFDPEP